MCIVLLMITMGNITKKWSQRTEMFLFLCFMLLFTHSVLHSVGLTSVFCARCLVFWVLPLFQSKWLKQSEIITLLWNFSCCCQILQINYYILRQVTVFLGDSGIEKNLLILGLHYIFRNYRSYILKLIDVLIVVHVIRIWVNEGWF